MALNKWRFFYLDIHIQAIETSFPKLVQFETIFRKAKSKAHVDRIMICFEDMADTALFKGKIRACERQKTNLKDEDKRCELLF